MSKQLLIGISGLMRSGKDTMADRIAATVPNTTILHFADPLYQVMNLVQEFLYLPHEKDRLFLQMIGTGWGRAKDPNIWINMLDRTIDSELSKGNNVVIPDARFLNEFEFLKNKGFTLVHVSRLEEFRVAAGASNMDHASEQDCKVYTGFDYTIYNNSSQQHYYDKIDSYIKTLLSN